MDTATDSDRKGGSAPSPATATGTDLAWMGGLALSPAMVVCVSSSPLLAALPLATDKARILPRPPPTPPLPPPTTISSPLAAAAAGSPLPQAAPTWAAGRPPPPDYGRNIGFVLGIQLETKQTWYGLTGLLTTWYGLTSLLTTKCLNLFQQAHNGILDLNEVAETLQLLPANYWVTGYS